MIVLITTGQISAPLFGALLRELYGKQLTKTQARGILEGAVGRPLTTGEARVLDKIVKGIMGKSAAVAYKAIQETEDLILLAANPHAQHIYTPGYIEGRLGL